MFASVANMILCTICLHDLVCSLSSSVRWPSYRCDSEMIPSFCSLIRVTMSLEWRWNSINSDYFIWSPLFLVQMGNISFQVKCNVQSFRTNVKVFWVILIMIKFFDLCKIISKCRWNSGWIQLPLGSCLTSCEVKRCRIGVVPNSFF